MIRRDSPDFYERFVEVLRCVRGISETAYADVGIGVTQAKILRVLGEKSPQSQAQLARATRMWPTLTGRTVEALIDHGWVRRKKSKEDRRQYVLELTAAGRRVCERVAIARKGVMASLASVLDEADARDFDRIATKILTAFPAHGDDD